RHPHQEQEYPPAPAEEIGGKPCHGMLPEACGVATAHRPSPSRTATTPRSQSAYPGTRIPVIPYATAANNASILTARPRSITESGRITVVLVWSGGLGHGSAPSADPPSPGHTTRDRLSPPMPAPEGYPCEQRPRLPLSPA